MKIVIAPDSFKGSLNAQEVASQIKNGLSKIFPEADYEVIPMADGGDGTMDVLLAANANSAIITKTVQGPLAKEVTANYGILNDTKTAIIEMAQASGIQYINSDNANPLIATSYGTGQLIKDALDRGIKNLIIGLGGSATNDAGSGMVQALGVKLLDEHNHEIDFGGGELGKLAKIDTTKLDRRLKSTNIILASDITNPLTGKQGASYVFGAQKGASPEEIEILDKSLQHFAKIIRRDLKTDFENYPGAGSAGGLGFALLSFTNAQLESGIDIVLKLTNFSQKVLDADLVFTGEGATDFQTKFGKTPYGVALAAKKAAPNCQVIVLTGNIGKDVNVLYGADKIDAIFSTESGAKSLAQAIKDSKADIQQTSENIARLLRKYWD